MWTISDQIQAYQFLRRRLVSALQTGDANNVHLVEDHPLYRAARVAALDAASDVNVGVAAPGRWRSSPSSGPPQAP